MERDIVNDERHLVSPRTFSEFVLWIGADAAHRQYRTWDEDALVREVDETLDELARR